MFGHKNAGPMETVLRFPANGSAKKSKPAVDGNIAKRNAGTTLDAYVQGEMYFAVASASRWTK